MSVLAWTSRNAFAFDANILICIPANVLLTSLQAETTPMDLTVAVNRKRTFVVNTERPDARSARTGSTAVGAEAVVSDRDHLLVEYTANRLSLRNSTMSMNEVHSG